jgi:23S rRNA pseudouridine1911/1915/1917 synthase
MPANGAFSIQIKPSDEGKRLDVLLASLLSDCTRTFVAGLIVDEHVRVDGQPKKPGYRVKSGQKISGRIPCFIIARILAESAVNCGRASCIG